MVNHLSDAGLLDETVIVFTSDHGTQLGEHGVFGKSHRHMNAYNTRVNMLVRHPDGPRGRVVDSFVQHIDLAPAVLDWLDVSHDRLDGDNMWDLATGTSDQLRDWVLSVWAHEASVRDQTWNAVVNVQDPEPEWKLYRVDDDRDNFVNVADRHPDAVQRQRDRLEAFLGSPLPARLPGRQIPTVYPTRAFEQARAAQSGGAP